MNNFLTKLYFEYFKLREQETKLRGIHDFDSDNANIRNDQMIADTQEQTKLLKSLIESYLNYLGL